MYSQISFTCSFWHCFLTEVKLLKENVHRFHFPTRLQSFFHTTRSNATKSSTDFLVSLTFSSDGVLSGKGNLWLNSLRYGIFQSDVIKS